MQYIIIIIGIINILGINLYYNNRKKRILSDINTNNDLSDEDYRFFRENQKKGFENNFYMLGVYVVVYYLFSKYRSERLSEFIIAMYTNITLILYINIIFIKNEIKKTMDYIKTEKEYNKDNKKFTFEIYVLEHRKKDILTHILTEGIVIYIVLYVIISTILTYIKF